MMRNYIIHFFIAFFIVFFPTLIFSWWVEPLHGDLTRIGRWSEHDFGPNTNHPEIKVETGEKFMAHPDIMVLGDSFSSRNLWQSILAKEQNKKIQTSDYESNCISNWINYSTTNPTGSMVIIQSVERAIISRFSKMPTCNKENSSTIKVSSVKIESSQRPIWPLTFDFKYLSTTALNTFKSNLLHEEYSNKYMTVNESLHNGCALFSNKRNDRILYYSQDDNKYKWTEKEINNSISNILKIQKNVESSGRKFVFIVAPDKSTIYKNCLKNKNPKEVDPNINQLLIDAGVNAPDMRSPFQLNVDKVIDLYDPDNTHWSIAGYILAGEVINRYTSRKSVTR